MQFTGKERCLKIKQNFELFLHLLLKLEIIWTVKLLNYEIISIILKHSEQIKDTDFLNSVQLK